MKRQQINLAQALWGSLVWSLVILVTGFVALSGPAANFTNGMVATVHPLATEAGLNVLKQGGNAIDATVAVALTLGVVDGENSGIGGGCFMLIRRANGETVAIDGRETAPAGASRDIFVRNGRAKTELSQTGALASGVPGSLAAYEFALSHYGRKKLKELISPAAEIAEIKGAIHWAMETFSGSQTWHLRIGR